MKQEDIIQNLSSQILQALIADKSLRFYIKNKEHKFIFVSDACANFHGFKPEEMLGKTDLDLFDNKFAIEKLEDEKKILETGHSIVDKLENEVDNAGNEFWALTTKFRIIDPITQEHYIFGFSRDKTKEIEQEKKLQEVQKNEALLRLVKGITNEFGNQLQVIRLFLQTFQLNEENGKIKEMLPNVLNATRNLEDLLNHLRLYSGQSIQKKEEVNINETIMEVYSTFQNNLPSNISIELSLKDKVYNIYFDKVQFKTIILSLLENAKEAINPLGNGKISITTDNVELTEEFCKNSSEDILPGDYVHISIQDNGEGMDKDTLARIFEPFFTTKYISKGIGVSIVYGILKNYGGSITYSSKRNVGTTVNIYIPALKTYEVKQLEEPSKIQDKKLNVLVADDEDLLLGMIKRLLDQKGFNVDTAYDGVEALDIFQEKEGNYDLVILDVKMPRMSGEDCYKYIRKMNSKIPILFITGGGNFIDTDFFKEHDNITIMKPFDLYDFLEKIYDTLKIEKDF